MVSEQNVCLTETNYEMFTPVPDTSAQLAVALLIHYSFDLSGYNALELVDTWQKQYPVSWVRIAIIEALYQGRYKAISVQQILTLWGRRGQATYHFNMEFERMICSKFPEKLTAFNKNSPNVQKSSIHSLPPPEKPLLPTANDLPPKEYRANITEKPNHNLTRVREETVSVILHKNSYRSIKQFTPEASDGSESFTSKLKAIAQEESSS